MNTFKIKEKSLCSSLVQFIESQAFYLEMMQKQILEQLDTPCVDVYSAWITGQLGSMFLISSL